ncbi:MAG: hypothetical protein ACJ79S_18100 [Gemmatimonadaceae bacterium]
MGNDNIEYPQRGYDTQDVKTQQETTRKGRKRRWGLKLFLYLVLLPVAVVAAWTWGALSFTYSRGDRTGYIQKLSKRGWVCPTWEGEMALSNVPGQMPEKFYFTIRDDDVAQQVQKVEGQRVSLMYEQHRGVPFSCFGDTEYYVSGVRAVGQ